MRPIPVDGGGGCVEPTAETIASGEYPIARDLYIYVSASKLAENPALEGVRRLLRQLGDLHARRRRRGPGALRRPRRRGRRGDAGRLGSPGDRHPRRRRVTSKSPRRPGRRGASALAGRAVRFQRSRNDDRGIVLLTAATTTETSADQAADEQRSPVPRPSRPGRAHARRVDDVRHHRADHRHVGVRRLGLRPPGHRGRTRLGWQLVLVFLAAAGFAAGVSWLAPSGVRGADGARLGTRLPGAHVRRRRRPRADDHRRLDGCSTASAPRSPRLAGSRAAACSTSARSSSGRS